AAKPGEILGPGRDHAPLVMADARPTVGCGRRHHRGMATRALDDIEPADGDQCRNQAEDDQWRMTTSAHVLFLLLLSLPTMADTATSANPIPILANVPR